MEHTLTTGDLVFYRHARYDYPFIGIVVEAPRGPKGLVGARFWLPERNEMGRTIALMPAKLDYVGSAEDLV